MRYYILLILAAHTIHKIMNRIKVILTEKEKTQTWLAKELGKSYNMVNSYVQNRRQPSIEILFAIADLLDVEAKDLIQERSKIKV